MGSDNTKERNENDSEATVIDSVPENANVITSTGNKRQRVQSMPEELKLNAEKSGQCRGFLNVLNSLNNSISGVYHACCKKDPESEHEWGSFWGDPVITSEECARFGTVKLVDGSLACEKCKRIRNKVGNLNHNNWIRRKDKGIQLLFSWGNIDQLSKLVVKEAIYFTKKVEFMCMFNNQSSSNF